MEYVAAVADAMHGARGPSPGRPSSRHVDHHDLGPVGRALAARLRAALHRGGRGEVRGRELFASRPRLRAALHRGVVDNRSNTLHTIDSPLIQAALRLGVASDLE